MDFTVLTHDMVVNAAIRVNRNAALPSDVSFYRVLDTRGAVQDPISGKILLPNGPGYRDAALHDANTVDALTNRTTENGLSSSRDISLKEQNLLAPALHVHGQHYLAFAAANSKAKSHFLMLGNNVLSFEANELDSTAKFSGQKRPLLDGNISDGVEGLNQSADADFNDLIVTLNFSLNGLI